VLFPKISPFGIVIALENSFWADIDICSTPVVVPNSRKGRVPSKSNNILIIYSVAK
jgi:hypothetical protein